MKGFFDIDFAKVMIATTTGLSNWLVNIDLVLKIAISAACLAYMIFKCVELWHKLKDR